MGWFVMAHADVLAALPESHPDYAQLSLQMKSLLTAVMAGLIIRHIFFRHKDHNV